MLPFDVSSLLSNRHPFHFEWNTISCELETQVPKLGSLMQKLWFGILGIFSKIAMATVATAVILLPLSQRGLMGNSPHKAGRWLHFHSHGSLFRVWIIVTPPPPSIL